MKFIKPNIVVSSCLGFESVRYNDQVIHDEWVATFKEHVNFIQVCPEVAIGMGVPRFPIRIVTDGEKQDLLQPATKKKFGSKMNKFSDKFLDKLPPVDGFILKSRSPSCGLNNVKVYKLDGNPAGKKRAGFFAEKVLDRFNGNAIEEEGRLKNLQIRHHFLTKVFALALLRDVLEKGSAKALIDFHTRYKYVLMSYSQAGLRRLGKIVANQKELGIQEAIEQYITEFKKVLNAPPSRSNVVNTMDHMFGYFKKQLNSAEKMFYLESLEMYRENRIPLFSIVTLIKSWAIRHNTNYLMDQAIFYPFPGKLAILEDSGKKMDI